MCVWGGGGGGGGGVRGCWGNENWNTTQFKRLISRTHTAANIIMRNETNTHMHPVYLQHHQILIDSDM